MASSLLTSTRLPKRSTTTTRPCASKSCTARSVVSSGIKKDRGDQDPEGICCRSMVIASRPVPAAAVLATCHPGGVSVKTPPCCSTLLTQAGSCAAASPPGAARLLSKFNSAICGSTGKATESGTTAAAESKIARGKELFTPRNFPGIPGRCNAAFSVLLHLGACSAGRLALCGATSGHAFRGRGKASGNHFGFLEKCALQGRKHAHPEQSVGNMRKSF